MADQQSLFGGAPRATPSAGDRGAQGFPSRPAPARSSAPPAPPPPLAERMRPLSLDEVLGQAHLLGKGKPLRLLAEAKTLPSLLLWGPPGTGKTTLARLLARRRGQHFAALSAVMAGLKDVRQVVAEAEVRHAGGVGTVLFLDEIHRFNKAQQDALLPHVEGGLLTLIGATTENPSFEVNAALLSRMAVFRLESLTPLVIESLLRRALTDPSRGLPKGEKPLEVEDDALQFIARMADGDARQGLGLLEQLHRTRQSLGVDAGPLDEEGVKALLQVRGPRYDKGAEEHYNTISAFIKSLRGSDPDGAVYYLARMLAGGEDARFIARRLIVFASEDVGNACPEALQVAVATAQAVEHVGLPEAAICLSQGVTFLASAPKSNASYLALNRAKEAVAETGSLPIPLKLRNARTKLMRDEGYGEGYVYPHDAPGHFSRQRYLPDSLGDVSFYRPSQQGAEAEIDARLKAWWGEGPRGSGSVRDDAPQGRSGPRRGPKGSRDPKERP